MDPPSSFTPEPERCRSVATLMVLAIPGELAAVCRTLPSRTPGRAR
jgi:hypothetical protein